MDRHCTNTAVRDKDWLRIIPIAYFFGSYVRNDGMNEPGWHYLVPQGHHFTVEHLVLHTLKSLSSTFAEVRQNVSTSPNSLHNRCSLKPWHQPIVPFPFLTSPSRISLKFYNLWQKREVFRNASSINTEEKFLEKNKFW